MKKISQSILITPMLTMISGHTRTLQNLLQTVLSTALTIIPFKPNNEVTAEQLAAMLTRAAGCLIFTQNSDVWYESIINIAEDYGIIKCGIYRKISNIKMSGSYHVL